MARETVYGAYFETAKYSVFVEYEPGPDGAIFITSVDIQERPVSLFQRRGKYRRGIVFNEQEEHAEAMQPYAWIEK